MRCACASRYASVFAEYSYIYIRIAWLTGLSIEKNDATFVMLFSLIVIFFYIRAVSRRRHSVAHFLSTFCSVWRNSRSALSCYQSEIWLKINYFLKWETNLQPSGAVLQCRMRYSLKLKKTQISNTIIYVILSIGNPVQVMCHTNTWQLSADLVYELNNNLKRGNA